MLLPASKLLLQQLFQVMLAQIRSGWIGVLVIVKVVAWFGNINLSVCCFCKRKLMYFLNDIVAFLSFQPLFSTSGASQPQSWTVLASHPRTGADVVRRWLGRLWG